MAGGDNKQSPQQWADEVWSHIRWPVSAQSSSSYFLAVFQYEDRTGSALEVKTVALIWIQALAPCGPAHSGPPRPHCNFISCRCDNERRVASTLQTPEPPIPTSQRAHAHKQKKKKKTYNCANACINMEAHSLTFHTLSHTHSHTLPTLHRPSQVVLLLR